VEYLSHNSLTLTTILDSATSRDADVGSNTQNVSSRLLGVAFTVLSEFSKVGFKLSSLTGSGHSTAYLYDNDAGTQIGTADISSLSGGDTFSISADYQTSTEYLIWIDGAVDAYGFNDSPSYPYTGPDIDITAGADDNETNNTRTDLAFSIVTIGDVGL